MEDGLHRGKPTAVAVLRAAVPRGPPRSGARRRAGQHAAGHGERLAAVLGPAANARQRASETPVTGLADGPPGCSLQTQAPRT